MTTLMIRRKEIGGRRKESSGRHEATNIRAEQSSHFFGLLAQSA
jgi:hypothetical protein